MPTYTNYNVFEGNINYLISLFTCIFICIILLLIFKHISNKQLNNLAKRNNKYTKLLEIDLARQNLIKRLK